MNFRNICIIAHVDHGKTTLVDKLLHQGGAYRENQRSKSAAMDSMDLEKERGSRSRPRTPRFRSDNKINIVDTPGHADFGGEVERIIRMVDGAILLVMRRKGRSPDPFCAAERRSPKV